MALLFFCRPSRRVAQSDTASILFYVRLFVAQKRWRSGSLTRFFRAVPAGASVRNAYLPLLQVWSLYVSRRVRLYQNAVSARVFRLSQRTLASNVTAPQRSTLVPLVQRDPPGRMAGAFFFFFLLPDGPLSVSQIRAAWFIGQQEKDWKKKSSTGPTFYVLVLFFLAFFLWF